jgi:hypothetical protein
MNKLLYKIVTRITNSLAYFFLKLQIKKVYDISVTESKTVPYLLSLKIINWCIKLSHKEQSLLLIFPKTENKKVLQHQRDRI